MGRTVSQDSTYLIRKNPLNITQLDGSDLVLSKNYPKEVKNNRNIELDDDSFDIEKNKHPGINIPDLLRSDTKDTKTEYEFPGAVTVKRPVTVNPLPNSPQKLAKEIKPVMETVHLPKLTDIDLASPSTLSSSDTSELRNSSCGISEPSSTDFENEFTYKPIEKIQLPLLDSPELFASFQEALNNSTVYNNTEQPVFSDIIKNTSNSVAVNSKPGYSIPVTTSTTTSQINPSSDPKSYSSGLARKNTITSNHETVSAPSSYQALQKLKKARQRAQSPLVHQTQFDDDSHIVEQLRKSPSAMSSSLVPEKGQEIVNLAIASPTTGYSSENSNDAESVYGDGSEINHIGEPPSPIMLSSPTLGELDPIDESDRGRLFLKISGIKDLQLPLDKKRHPKFNLTLDNGIQTVKTYPIDLLAKDPVSDLIPIDHEFELVVGGDELQVVLTLSGQMDPLPKPSPVKLDPQPIMITPSAASKPILDPPKNRSQSAMTPPSSPKKKKFGFFTRSPKKQKEEPPQLNLPQDPVIQRRSPSPLPKPATLAPIVLVNDVWAGKVGRRGEFSRAYLVESQFEEEVYGKPQTFILSCFNEWAVKDSPKSHSGSPVKTAPNRICGLQVTMMFIPRFYKSEDLPTSMKASIAELNKVSQLRNVHFNGYLTQQGGDCRFWRRRWFTLEGPNMVGHHEETHKVRNMINICNVVLIDYSNESGIYDERAFKMEFKDGEILSFYADTIEERSEWMKVLNMSLTHCTGKSRRWYDIVIQRHEENRRKKSILNKKYQTRKQLSDTGNSTFQEEM